MTDVYEDRANGMRAGIRLVAVANDKGVANVADAAAELRDLSSAGVDALVCWAVGHIVVSMNGLHGEQQSLKIMAAELNGIAEMEARRGR